MSQIKKRSIKAVIWIFSGFAVGAINMLLFTNKLWFQPQEFGLTNSLREVGLLVAAISTFGLTSVVVKFFPYYQDNLEPKQNDLLTLAFKYSLIGFVLTSILLYCMQGLVIKKFETNSPLLVDFFYYTLPMGFLILIYNLLESHAYCYNKGVLLNFLKEFALRFYITTIIILKLFGIIDFQAFITLFVLQYAFIITILAVILKREGRLIFSFEQSRISVKFRKKIFAMMFFTAMVIIVAVLRSTIDTLVLASRLNLEKTAVFALSTYVVSFLQAPFRSVVSITTPILSRAWKEKNYHEIFKIYKQSSINLLTYALLVFSCILLNFETAIETFGMDTVYLEGKGIVIITGIVAIIETGTGVNAQIIGTSTYWKFELWTSVLLTILIIPLSYIFTVHYGIIGPALASLISFSIYNTIRFWFLKTKFNMQPFTTKTMEVILLAIANYLVTYYLFKNTNGILHIVGSTTFYVIVFFIYIFTRNISPDFRHAITWAWQKFIKKE